MKYEEAREFIRKSDEFGWRPGLETITELMRRLGNPQDELRVIHVAGTNGKGSVSAFIAYILAAGGYRVGRYISPSVFSYREKIMINSRGDYIQGYIQKDNTPQDEISQDTSLQDSILWDAIPRETVARAVDIIKPACEAMVKEGFAHPTSFEIETAMAFLYFLWEKTDYAVLEVGLGGRLDATNIIKRPLLSVITSISMDHVGILGDTIEKIAKEKAGIIKEGVPVITCAQDPGVISVLNERAGRLQAPFHISDPARLCNIRYSLEGTEFSHIQGNITQQYKIRLLGQYQPANAQLAIEAVKLLFRDVTETTLRKGLLLAKWPGRFELIHKNPYIIIDGAHNEAAAVTLRKSIEIYFTNHRIIYIIGILADKDYRSILRITVPLAKAVIAVTPDNRRALPSHELAGEAGAYCDKVYDARNMDNALAIALREAGSDGVIIAFGSLFCLSSLVNALKVRKDDKDDR